ncbi:Uncharacterised protein [Mycobacterium tuberculosis]|nr:Uncharacterised protein [Mycobacterium tuberculosis]
MRVRAFWQPTHQPLPRTDRVADQLHQTADRQMVRQTTGRCSPRRVRTFSQQCIDVSGPGGIARARGMIDVGGASGQVGRHGRRHQRRAPLHIAATCGQRISGPNRLDSVVTQWVSLIAGGRRRPLLDDSARITGSGRTVNDVLEFAQEFRWPARLCPGGPPMVAGHQQSVLSPGNGHVQQSTLLVNAPPIEQATMFGDLVRQLFSVSDS